MCDFICKMYRMLKMEEKKFRLDIQIFHLFFHFYICVYFKFSNETYISSVIFSISFLILIKFSQNDCHSNNLSSISLLALDLISLNGARKAKRCELSEHVQNLANKNEFICKFQSFNTKYEMKKKRIHRLFVHLYFLPFYSPMQ